MGFVSCDSFFHVSKYRIFMEDGMTWCILWFFKYLQCGRHGRNITEYIVVFQTVAHCAKATHGETCNECIFSFVGEWKHSSCDLYQFLADVITKVIVWQKLIDIEAVFPRWHNHCQVMIFRKALDVCAVYPVGVVA